MKKIMIVALVWTFVCAAMFYAARQLGTAVPSAGFGHVEAEEKALEVLVDQDAVRYGDYIVINSALSAVGSRTGQKRWIVLCNRSSSATAESALIVVLSRDGEEVLGFRRPGSTKVEPRLP